MFGLKRVAAKRWKPTFGHTGQRWRSPKLEKKRAKTKGVTGTLVKGGNSGHLLALNGSATQLLLRARQPGPQSRWMLQCV